MTNLTTTSDWLAHEIAEVKGINGQNKFKLLGDNLGGKGLPLVAWHLNGEDKYDGMRL